MKRAKYVVLQRLGRSIEKSYRHFNLLKAANTSILCSDLFMPRSFHVCSNLPVHFQRINRLMILVIYQNLSIPLKALHTHRHRMQSHFILPARMCKLFDIVDVNCSDIAKSAAIRKQIEVTLKNLLCKISVKFIVSI